MALSSSQSLYLFTFLEALIHSNLTQTVLDHDLISIIYIYIYILFYVTIYFFVCNRGILHRDELSLRSQ